MKKSPFSAWKKGYFCGVILVLNAVILSTAPSFAQVEHSNINVNPRECELTLLAPRSFAERLIYNLRVPFIWAGQMLHNGFGVFSVLDIIKFRPISGGLVSSDHPWVTGVNPRTGKTIWNDNVLFRSLSSFTSKSDEEIITSVGKYLSRMVSLSASSSEHPNGMNEFSENGVRQRRMPHAINYIHGAVHYNGGWILLNNFEEGFYFFSDPNFRDEVRRFAAEEKREVVIVFRDKDYDRDRYAEFVTFLRTIYPWFSNSNGPKKKVLWGNPAPYAVVNIITGNWQRDVYALKTPEGAEAVVRPNIEVNRYFQHEQYVGTRLESRLPERLLAEGTARRLRLRGDKGNLYFVDETELKKRRLERTENE